MNSKASNFPNECLYTSIGSKPLEAILLSRLLWAQAPEIGGDQTTLPTNLKSEVRGHLCLV